jgi:hypothetical protein
LEIGSGVRTRATNNETSMMVSRANTESDALIKDLYKQIEESKNFAKE